MWMQIFGPPGTRGEKSQFPGLPVPVLSCVTVPRDPGLVAFDMKPRLYLPISRPGAGGWSPW